MEKKKPNRLLHSISPYLRQHAYNPVDWYEWGPEAFAKAESENKLMLVSIGYSACHWCHVMAHECFEDEVTAALMNRHFVCIKIDREELPDIDSMYMDACQLISGNGGWPLNAFALPDKRPLHALTYAPRQQWQNLLQNIADLWQNKPDTAYEYAEKLSHGMRNMSLPPALKPESSALHFSDDAFSAFQDYYDPVFGGGKRAPKFPLPANWNFLLQYGSLKQEPAASDMALHTLRQMALGGIHDVVEGGFARYSTDEKWFAPHFEKMLYDNAQLLGLYSLAHAHCGDPLFKTAAEGIYKFCRQQWLAENGVYQSAMDADSEGIEGLYYTYTAAELRQALGETEPFFSTYFQCTDQGNWEHGRNILFASDTMQKAAGTMGLDAPKLEHHINAGMKLLKALRSKRTAPDTDDKCICAWNGLMLKGLSEMALHLDHEQAGKDAAELARSMHAVFDTSGGLKRINKDNLTKIDAYLEDYAAYAAGLLALYRYSLDEQYLHQALSLCARCIDLFYRPDKGFFTFSSKSELIEKFDTSDDVMPSGNSMMAHNLRTLSWYFSRSEYRAMADNMCLAMKDLIAASAPWYSHWALLSLTAESETEQYVYACTDVANARQHFAKHALRANALPGLAIPGSRIPLFQGKQSAGKPVLYLCKNQICLEPEELP